MIVNPGGDRLRAGDWHSAPVAGSIRRIVLRIPALTSCSLPVDPALLLVTPGIANTPIAGVLIFFMFPIVFFCVLFWTLQE